MNENRSSNTLCCAWNIRTGWNPDIGDRLLATFQLVAMLGDIVGGQPAGLPASVFRNYLLADTAYVGLLFTQGLIMAITVGTWALPHLHGHWPGALRIVRH